MLKTEFTPVAVGTGWRLLNVCGEEEMVAIGWKSFRLVVGVGYDMLAPNCRSNRSPSPWSRPRIGPRRPPSFVEPEVEVGLSGLVDECPFLGDGDGDGASWSLPLLTSLSRYMISFRSITLLPSTSSVKVPSCIPGVLRTTVCWTVVQLPVAHLKNPLPMDKP